MVIPITLIAWSIHIPLISLIFLFLNLMGLFSTISFTDFLLFILNRNEWIQSIRPTFEIFSCNKTEILPALRTLVCNFCPVLDTSHAEPMKAFKFTKYFCWLTKAYYAGKGLDAFKYLTAFKEKPLDFGLG